MRLVAGCLITIALMAATPQTSDDYYARYGKPDAERFVVRPDLVLSVEYGADGAACKMRIEPRQSLLFAMAIRTNPTAPVDEVMQVLSEVVPPETRGKELGPGNIFGHLVGTPPPTEYENVTIIQEFGTSKPLALSSVAVLFKRPECDSLPKYSDVEWLRSLKPPSTHSPAGNP
jgi:hypothetical protein